MLRSGFLWLSERRGVFNFIKRNGLAGRLASRFVAGEGLGDAVEATRTVNERGMTVTLDHLGESVTRAEDARAACDHAMAMLDWIHRDGLDGNISVKLTQMGLDIDRQLAVDNMTRILERAGTYETFVRIDMEASNYVERTLSVFAEDLRPTFGDLVGVVVQSMLRRSERDIDDLIAMGARVRLVKGAYAEPGEIAFPDKQDVDAAFASATERLLVHGNYPAIATHDGALIDHARRFASARGIPADRYEFQLLYGVRRDLQASLREQGHHVRIYVPFGTEWYPYLMRRLAERPANLAFMVGSVAREVFART